MIEESKKILLKMKEEIIDEISANIKIESADFKPEIGDTSDQAGEERDREISLLLCNRDREKLVSIEDALERIEDGTYGICEECEEEINEGRLKVMPFATLCVACKSEMEKKTNDKNLVYEPEIYRKLDYTPNEDDK